MEEFRRCQKCGYSRGFHSSFKKEGDKVKVIYICPDCGSAYDLGIYVPINDINPKKVGEFDEK